LAKSVNSTDNKHALDMFVRQGREIGCRLSVVARSCNEDAAVFVLHSLHKPNHDYEICVTDGRVFCHTPGHVNYASVFWFCRSILSDLDKGLKCHFNLSGQAYTRKDNFSLACYAAERATGCNRSYYSPVLDIRRSIGRPSWTKVRAQR
jgi:hypothetical protein